MQPRLRELEIVTAARKWLHVKEIGKNEGFDDDSFQSGFEALGWKPGSLWSIYYPKLVWYEVYRGSAHQESLQQAFASNDPYRCWELARTVGLKTSLRPIVGGIGIVRTTLKKSQAWIFTEIRDQFDTKIIEGNIHKSPRKTDDAITERFRKFAGRSSFSLPKKWKYVGCIYYPDYQEA